MPEFYGFKIQVGETKDMGLAEGTAATIGQVSLANPTSNARYILSIKLRDEEFVLATLTRDKSDCLQDLNLFADDNAQWCLRTEDNTVDRASVHVIGYLQDVFNSPGSSDAESFDEDEYNERLLAQMNGGNMEDSEGELDEEDEEDGQDEEAPPLIQIPTKTKKQAVIKPVEEKPAPSKRPNEDSKKTPRQESQDRGEEERTS